MSLAHRCQRRWECAAAAGLIVATLAVASGPPGGVGNGLAATTMAMSAAGGGAPVAEVSVVSSMAVDVVPSWKCSSSGFSIASGPPVLVASSSVPSGAVAMLRRQAIPPSLHVVSQLQASSLRGGQMGVNIYAGVSLWLGPSG